MSFIFYRFRYCLLALITVVLPGCGSGIKLVEVSGRITQNNQPRPGLSVTFQPVAKSSRDTGPGPASYGKTDAEGRYRLRTITTDADGAVVGQHAVAIHVFQPETRSDVEQSDPDAGIPHRFRDSSLKVDVPPTGLTTANFDLSQP